MATKEMFIGRREQITIGDESSYGTEVTPDKFLGKNVRFLNPQNSQNWKPIQSAGRDTRNVETYQLGEKSLRFRLRWTVTDWEFLKYTTHGNISTVDNGDGTYTHTLTVSNTLNSFTLERAFRGSSNHIRRYLGCVFMGEITIKFSAGEGEEAGWVEAEGDVLAQDIKKATSITSVTFPTKEGFQFRHTKLTIEGTEITEVNSGEIRLNNRIDPTDSRYANVSLDRKIGDPVPKGTRFTIRANLNISDSTYFDYWNTESSLTGTNKIEFIKDSGDKVVFDFNNEWYMLNPFSQTNYEGVTNADIVGNIPKLNIDVTDDISSY